MHSMTMLMSARHEVLPRTLPFITWTSVRTPVSRGASTKSLNLTMTSAASIVARDMLVASPLPTTEIERPDAPYEAGWRFPFAIPVTRSERAKLC